MELNKSSAREFPIKLPYKLTISSALGTIVVVKLVGIL